MRKLVMALGSVFVAVGAVRLAAPEAGPHDGPSTHDLVEQLASSGLSGHDLANAAIRATGRSYRAYSAWHLWESPATSLRHRHGWSHQYNAVLADVLAGLGFDTRMVHTAWVRGSDHPWWHKGHTWVKVRIDGRWLDACASSEAHVLGDLPNIPASEELPYHGRTRTAVRLFLAPFVIGAVWRSWLTRQPVAPWVYRRRPVA